MSYLNLQLQVQPILDRKLELLFFLFISLKIGWQKARNLSNNTVEWGDYPRVHLKVTIVCHVT